MNASSQSLNVFEIRQEVGLNIGQTRVATDPGLRWRKVRALNSGIPEAIMRL